MRSRMIALGRALRLSVFSKYIFNVNPYKEYHSSQVWNRFNKSSPKPSLGLVYLPRKSKLDLVDEKWRKKRKRKRKEKKMEMETEIGKKDKSYKAGPLLILCKKKKLNHHFFMSYDKPDEIPLASGKWRKRKSNGDYFSILPTSENPAFIYPEGLASNPDSFKSLGLCEELLQGLKNIGIKCPTFVQYAAIPKIISGKHVLLSAEAGCGKTLAYVLPILENILKWKPKIDISYNSPLGVIVVPTRELAIQVGKVVKSLVEGLDINCEILLSNFTKNFLLNIHSDFIKCIDIVVCTPGVLCKLTYHKVYSLSNCLNLVFDEADMLLDDTFIKETRKLFTRVNFNFDDVKSSVPKGAQLSLVSATIPYQIHECLNQVFPSHLLENIVTRYLHRTLPHITHKFIRCSKLDKRTNVLNLVKSYVEKNEPVVVFSNKTESCNWLAHFLRENNIECARCNSHMSYNERIAELEKFQQGKVRVMSCTDLISRGHNITEIQHVINYDFPKFVADYVHRSGRTGRIGISEELKNSCNVTSFICSESDALLLQEIELSVRKNNTLPHVNNNIARLLETPKVIVLSKRTYPALKNLHLYHIEYVLPSKHETLPLQSSIPDILGKNYSRQKRQETDELFTRQLKHFYFIQIKRSEKKWTTFEQYC